MTKLDNRLQAVADFVPLRAKVADIGADHGHLALNLLENDKVDSVIVTDKNSEPLNSAQNNCKLFSSDINKIKFRLGEGLRVLQPNEVDTICIAGMGGALIGEILSESPNIILTTKRLILQPMNSVKPLRTWLYKSGWHIVDEKLVEADKKIYVIILAEPGAVNLPTNVELQVGPVILEKYRHTTILHEYLNEKIDIMQRVVTDMDRSILARATQKYFALKKEIAELKQLLKEDEPSALDEKFSESDLPTMIPKEVFY